MENAGAGAQRLLYSGVVAKKEEHWRRY